MDYQYDQLKNLDYWKLVNMLVTNITVKTRSYILEILTKMNNQLLEAEYQTTNPYFSQSISSRITSDLSRPSVLNSRKKDLFEIQHPSENPLISKGKNPIPLNMALPSSYSHSNKIDTDPMSALFLPDMDSAYANNIYNPFQKSTINIDDVLDDLVNDSDGSDTSLSLDDKLMNIKNLHNKLIADKRRRKYEKDQRTHS